MKPQSYQPQHHTPKLSSLTQSLHQILKTHPTPQSLHNKHFLNQLQVLILNKKPQTHSFICDSSTSIQVQFKTEKSKSLEQYDLKPWNKVMTHYYQVSHQHDKYLYTLNCNDKTLFQKYGVRTGEGIEANRMKAQSRGGMFAEETSSALESLDKEYEPHAYEPLYYFPRNVFDYFLKNRQTLTLPEPLQKILIYDWMLKVVNISKSNWYAFVIEIHKFKFLNQKIWTDCQMTNQKASSSKNSISLKNISSILYDSRMQSILQKMRLVDVRLEASKQQDTDQEEEISMCYHLRNVQATYKLPKLSQFVALDTKGEVLKFDKTHPTHFIPIGQLQGMCSFPQPVSLKQPQKQQQLRQLNAFSMKGLYEILNKQTGEVKRGKKFQQKLNRVRNGKDKIGEKDWSRMIEERLQNSHYRIQQQKNEPSTFFSDDSEFESDSQDRELGSIRENDGVGEQNKGILGSYQQILNNQVRNNQSQSSQEEENEYFRTYREEMKKMFEK